MWGCPNLRLKHRMFAKIESQEEEAKVVHSTAVCSAMLLRDSGAVPCELHRSEYHVPR